MKNRIKNNKEILYLLPAALVCLAVVLSVAFNKPVYKKLDKILTAQTIKADEENNNEKNREDLDDEKALDETIKEEETKKTDVKEGLWKDGTYTGAAKGFGGEISVEVTIKDGKITAISVVNCDGETPEYFSKAKSVIDSILKSQSVDVDVVSGATFSSNGIINAVIDALNKAVTDPDKVVKKNENKSSKSTDKGTSKKTKKEIDNTNTPKDGIYKVSSICDRFGYTMSFKVKFKNGKCVAIYDLKITNNDDEENESYYKKAWKDMVKKILKSQSSDVDVTSGATYSANAILDGYITAYNKAVKANGGKSTSKKENNSDNKSKNNNSDNDNKDNSIDEDSKENGEVVLDGIPKDGTYRVSTICYPDSYEDFKAYTMYADVTFKDGKLVSIDNFSSDDESNKKYYEKAANGKGKVAGVVSQLIEKQSAKDISAVSGATCSSKAIRKLYILAFNEAAGSNLDADDNLSDNSSGNSNTSSGSDSSNGSDGENASGSGESGSNLDDNESDAGNVTYKDCTIDITDTVWPDDWEDFEEYDMTARFVFAGGTLESISIISLTDDSNMEYCERALNGTEKITGMFSQFKELMSTKKVDTVSGATCSSESFIRMFDKTLSEARE